MSNNREVHKKRLLWFSIAIVLAMLVYFLTSNLEEPQRIVLSIVTITVVLWVSETIPLFVTALLSSLLLITIGKFPVTSVFSPYFDSIIVLFLGSFMLARAMQKHGLDIIIAERCLRHLGTNPYLIVGGMMLITAFLSMWMSNTAAVAIMIPIILAILRENDLLKNKSHFAKATILAIAYAGTIGGVATLVGSPPNAIAKRFLEEATISLSFVDWMIGALPFVLISLVYTWALILFLNKPTISELSFKLKQHKFGKEQSLVLFIFIATAIGWLTTNIHGFGSSTVALCSLITLYVIGLLDQSDLTKISWGTLLLFGGGLALGDHISKVGIDILLADALKQYLIGLPIFVILLSIVFLGIILTMIASNTASAVIAIPLMIPLAQTLGIDVQALVMLIAISVSIDFMMPVGTPPNAIAYATGLLRIKEMIKNGFLVNIGLGVLLAAMYYFFWI